MPEQNGGAPDHDSPEQQEETNDLSADVSSEPNDGTSAELNEKLQYALADLDNLRKRYQRELERERSAERDRVARAWLPVIDNLEMAVTAAESDDTGVLEGIKTIRDEAISVMEQLGYPKFEDIGEPFDPRRHEAIGSVTDAELAPNTVVTAVRAGFGTDPVLRPAAVMVARSSDG